MDSSNLPFDKVNYFNETSIFIDKHSRKIQFGCYVLGAVGIGILSRSLRLGTKFVKAERVPAGFIQKHMQLRGLACHARPDGVFLVDHYPIFRIPLKLWKSKARSKDPYYNMIPVKLHGIDINAMGFQRMKNYENQVIWFTLLGRQEDSLSCIVKYAPTKRFWSQKCELNTELVKEGLATVNPETLVNSSDKVLEEFCKRLIKNQNKAQNSGKGIWKEDSTLLQRIMYKLNPFK